MSLFGRFGGREDEGVRFTPWAYLRDRWFSLVMAALCIGSLFCVLPVLGVTWDGCLLCSFLVALCCAVALIYGYVRRRAYYRELRSFAHTFGTLRQYAMLMEAPSFLEGTVSHDALTQLAQASEEQMAAEQQANRAYREYVELWIHEIKTPIAAAKLMLATQHGEQAHKLKGELERIEAQVDQALYSARSLAVAKDYSIRSMNLAHAVREACKKNAHYLIERNVSVDVQVDDSLTVMADEPWVVFMLSQMVANAATYEARTIVFAAHEEEADTPRGRTVLEVRDDGCGIPAADVPRVFDRGFTGTVGRTHGSATGMGLAICASLCAAMSLGLAIDSAEQEGTTLYLTFPHDRRRLTN